MGVQPSGNSDAAEEKSYTIHVDKGPPSERAGYDSLDQEAVYEIALDPEDRTAVFDLALKDDSDDGGLLDWEAYAGKHARRCCGCSCAWLPSCCSCVPPAWWYGYSKRQRLLIQTACLCGVGLLVAVAVGLPLWFTLAVCHGSFMC